MKKKLSLFLVALLSITAIAATQALTRRAKAELTVISEATTWDFASGVTGSKQFTTNEDKNTENIYAFIDGLSFDNSFQADALAFTGEYPVRDGAYAQNGTLHFKTSVAGNIKVTFNDTGSNASPTAVKRYLVVNGVTTEYWTSRENNGTEPYAAQTNVTSGEIAVPAGDVTIKGTSAIRVSKIVFTPSVDAEGGEKVIYGYPSGAESANSIELGEGVTLAITGNAQKSISSSSNITINGTSYTTLKLSNGAQNTLTLPKKAVAVTFYSFVNKDSKDNGTTENYWKEVGGTSYTAETSGGAMACFRDDLTQPDARRFEFSTPTDKITFNNAGNQLCCVIEVEYVAEGNEGGEVKKEYPKYVYNFAGAQAAGETPLVGLNQKGGFYIWEREDKADSNRQDFKGYTNYKGSNLAAACHVWRRTDAYNNASYWVDGGMYCPNDREMVIDGVEAGMKVTIAYNAAGAKDKSIIWASATGEGHITKATIGKDTEEAVSGVTEIPSKAAIHITETCGYFGIKVKKGMIIKKITIEGDNGDEELPAYQSTFDFNSLAMIELTDGVDAAISDLVIYDDITDTKMTVSASGKEEAPNHFVEAANGNIQLELNGGTMTFDSPKEDYSIKKIVFHYATWDESNSADVAAVAAPRRAAGEGLTIDAEKKTATWTGSSQQVIVNVAGLSQINNITIEIGERKGESVELDMADGSNLNKKVDEIYNGNPYVGKITLNLAKDGKYTVDGPLFIGRPLVINGAEGAVIDASANKNPFILMRPIADNASLNESGAYEIDSIVIKNVKITGVKNRLLYADRQNYLFGKIVVDNSIIEIDGSTPRSIFDFYCGGNFKELSILNSTLSADPSNAMRGGLLSTQSSKSIIEMGGTEQKISIKNSTLYNIAKGMTPVLLQRHSQAYLTFEVKNSVIVNSGEAGKFALGLNEGQESNQPKWLVETNTFTFDGKDSGAGETIAKATVPGPVSFVDAANNDFTLNILSDVFDAGIGDPRWLVPAEGSIVVEPASGDLGAAVAAATEGKTVKTLLVKLAKDGQYTTTKPIVTGGALVLRGNGATIDASELNDNMIAMAAVENPTVWTEGNIIINDLTVKGLKKALFYSTNKKYVAKDFIINNSVIEQAGDATTIDYTKGGTALNLVLSNSTFYAPTATTKSFYSSQGGEKATEYASDAVQTFNILHSTFVNLASGKNFFTHRQNSQKWLAFNIEDNIFVDCGKSGQTIKGINGGGSSANPVWNVKHNAFNFGGEDTGAAESTGDDKEPMQGYVAGVVTFKNAAAGDFTLGYTSPQHDANIGDPRWVITPENVTVNIASGDINAALDEALAKVKAVKDIHINLTDGGKYTISKTIVVPNGLHIVTGDIMALGHQNATIDASGLEGPMITTPAEAPDEWVKANILIDDVTIKGLKKPLFASAAKNYYYEQFSIWGSVIELAADVTTLDFTKGSVANLMISSSTIYAPTATTKAFYSSQSGQKATEYAEDAEQKFIIFASTLYNLAPGKNFFTHRQSNQKWLTYNLQNNIFVNCGKSGQVVKGVNGGQSGKNPKWMIVNNLFNYDGKDTSAEESTGDADEPVEKSIPGVVTFADANGGDFNATITLAEGAEKPALAGDVYHWKINYAEATAIEGVKTAEDENIDLENTVIYNLNGQRVDKAQAKRGVFIVNGKKVVIK